MVDMSARLSDGKVCHSSPGAGENGHHTGRGWRCEIRGKGIWHRGVEGNPRKAGMTPVADGGGGRWPAAVADGGGDGMG